jgi:hypothetical protein
VETTVPQQRSIIQQHFGARRFAYNWALAAVKANLNERAVDPSIPPLAWTLPTLRKAWNQAKGTIAPWWPTCSKEAYACGIDDLTTALQRWLARWLASRDGHRSKESTRRLERKLVRGQARVLSMPLSERGDRLFISVATIVVLGPNRRPRDLYDGCGIDLGVGTEWAVIAHADDSIERIAHPAPWGSVQQQRRRLARCLVRRTVGSRGHRQAKSKLAALESAGSARSWPTNVLGTVVSWSWPTVGSPPPGSITAAVATALISNSPTPVPFVGDHGGQAQAAPGRARPQKTTARWQRPMTPEPTPQSWGRGTPNRGAREE